MTTDAHPGATAPVGPVRHTELPPPYSGAPLPGGSLPGASRPAATTSATPAPAVLPPTAWHPEPRLEVRPDGTVVPPRSVQRAVFLMWSGAGLAVASALYTGLRFRSILTDTATTSGLGLDLRVVDAVGTGGAVGAVLGGLVTAALWMWMASATGAGKGWARVVATVFWVFSMLGLLGGLAAAVLGGEALLSLLVSLPGHVVGTVAVVLLWVRSSTVYYSACARRRR